MVYPNMFSLIGQNLIKANFTTITSLLVPLFRDAYIFICKVLAPSKKYKFNLKSLVIWWNTELCYMPMRAVIQP